MKKSWQDAGEIVVIDCGVAEWSPSHRNVTPHSMRNLVASPLQDRPVDDRKSINDTK
jgi:hypothetical protein